MDDANALQKTQSKTVMASKDLRSMLSSDSVKNRFSEIMKEKAPAFISSILNVSESSPQMKSIALNNGVSIVRAAAVAASLDLPIDRNLGFAWVIPYGTEVQFQIGWRGFVQLSLRTGQYSKMNVVKIFENQFKSYNALTEELDADFLAVPSGKVLGFVVYFKLVNGFEKTAYFTKAELLAHGKRYSKTFGNGPWKTHEDEMCSKTALKNTLSKWGIMSTEMCIAKRADQAVIVGDDVADLTNYEYKDAVDGEFSEPSEKTTALKNKITGKEVKAPPTREPGQDDEPPMTEEQKAFVAKP